MDPTQNNPKDDDLECIDFTKIEEYCVPKESVFSTIAKYLTYYLRIDSGYERVAKNYDYSRIQSNKWTWDYVQYKMRKKFCENFVFHAIDSLKDPLEYTTYLYLIKMIASGQERFINLTYYEKFILQDISDLIFMNITLKHPIKDLIFKPKHGVSYTDLFLKYRIDNARIFFDLHLSRVNAAKLRHGLEALQRNFFKKFHIIDEIKVLKEKLQKDKELNNKALKDQALELLSIPRIVQSTNEEPSNLANPNQNFLDSYLLVPQCEQAQAPQQANAQNDVQILNLLVADDSSKIAQTNQVQSVRYQQVSPAAPQQYEKFSWGRSALANLQEFIDEFDFDSPNSPSTNAQTNRRDSNRVEAIVLNTQSKRNTATIMPRQPRTSTAQQQTKIAQNNPPQSNPNAIAFKNAQIDSNNSSQPSSIMPKQPAQMNQSHQNYQNYQQTYHLQTQPNTVLRRQSLQNNPEQHMNYNQYHGVQPVPNAVPYSYSSKPNSIVQRHTIPNSQEQQMSYQQSYQTQPLADMATYGQSQIYARSSSIPRKTMHYTGGQQINYQINCETQPNPNATSSTQTRNDLSYSSNPYYFMPIQSTHEKQVNFVQNYDTQSAPNMASSRHPPRDLNYSSHPNMIMPRQPIQNNDEEQPNFMDDDEVREFLQKVEYQNLLNDQRDTQNRQMQISNNDTSNDAQGIEALRLNLIKDFYHEQSTESDINENPEITAILRDDIFNKNS